MTDCYVNIPLCATDIARCNSGSRIVLSFSPKRFKTKPQVTIPDKNKHFFSFLTLLLSYYYSLHKSHSALRLLLPRRPDRTVPFPNGFVFALTTPLNTTPRGVTGVVPRLVSKEIYFKMLRYGVLSLDSIMLC